MSEELEDLETGLKEAKLLMKQGSAVDAIALLQDSPPGSRFVREQGRFLMARGFLKLGFDDIACNLLKETDFKEAFPDESDRAGKLFQAGEICQQHEDIDQAFVFFKMVKKLDASYHGLAEKLQELGGKGDWESAAERLVIDPRYQKINLLGRGGMGVVFAGWDTDKEREVAVKVIDFRYRKDSEICRRFMKEASVSLKITHPNIGRVLSIENPDSPYLVMELIRGLNMREMLEKRGRFSPKRVHKYMVQIARALEYAHAQSIIHRDLKPENMMITRDDTVKILDFGLAKILSMSTVTHEGAMLGTPDYMSPEQIMGKAVDARSDIYSLGVIVFEMIAGRRPFIGKNVTQQHVEEEPPALGTMAPGVPAWLEQLAARCLEKEPVHRYQNCAELLQDILEQVGEPPAGVVSDEDIPVTEEYGSPA